MIWGRGLSVLCIQISSYPRIICQRDYCFPSLKGPGPFAETWLTIDVWAYVWTLSSIPLTYMFILTPLTYCFDDSDFVGRVEVWYVSLPTLFFFFKIILAFLCSLQFHMNFRIYFQFLDKDCIGVCQLFWVVLPS